MTAGQHVKHHVEQLNVYNEVAIVHKKQSKSDEKQNNYHKLLYFNIPTKKNRSSQEDPLPPYPCLPLLAERPHD